jgi:superfamily II DNA/RNA helicase
MGDVAVASHWNSTDLIFSVFCADNNSHNFAEKKQHKKNKEGEQSRFGIEGSELEALPVGPQDNKFESLAISELTKKAIRDMGFETMMQVQAKVLHLTYSFGDCPHRITY